MHHLRTRGISAVEIIIGVAILAALVVAAALILGLFVRSATTAQERTTAIYHAEAGLEYLRHLRSQNWTNISTLTTEVAYGFAVSTTTLAIAPSPDIIDGYYTRSFTLTALSRDASGDIVPSTTPSATVDPDSYYMTVQVSYGSADVSLSGILTNLHNE
jgi:Tfp pilus assembly protein PilV